MNAIADTIDCPPPAATDGPPPARGTARPPRDCDPIIAAAVDGDAQVLRRAIADAITAARPPDPQHASADAANTLQRTLTAANEAIAAVDDLLEAQVNEVLRAPAVRRLEASWLGLLYLVEQARADDTIRVRMLSATWADLSRDVTGAIDFDQSKLFALVYDGEFGMPGGEPFGLLVGDYEIGPRPSDLAALTAISGVAAAAFAPFVAAAAPALLGVDDFAALARHPAGPPVSFDEPEYAAWRSFRQTEDARFVGLTLPRVLMRRRHDDRAGRAVGFRFREHVDGPTAAGHLWGNPAYALAGVVIRTFAASHWTANLRGVRWRPDPDGTPERGGGLVTDLPAAWFDTDSPGVAPRGLTDVALTDRQEKAFADAGLIALTPCRGAPAYGAFYTTPSVQKPRSYTGPADTANARLAASLQYLMCASRFAHYLKAIARDRTGAPADAAQWQDALGAWLALYTTDDGQASPEVRAEFPLRRSEVSVRAIPGRPGTFACDMLLAPHHELDDLAGCVVLKTELKPLATG